MHASDPVNRLMTEPVLTVDIDDSVQELMRLFVGYPVHHLPVIKDRCVVGMLSSADMMKLEFFLPPPGPARDKLLSDRFRVDKIMRTPVVTVAEHETVQRAAELMAINGFHSLPVVNGQGHLIGIVTTTDFMNGCLRSSHVTSAIDPADRALEHVQPMDMHLADVTAKAREAISANNDPDGVASALLHTQRRLSALERVAQAAKRYVNAGQDEQLHSVLKKAIDHADQLDQSSSHTSILGLAGDL